MSSSVKDLKKSFNKLCGPAQFYLGMSLISIVIYLVNMMEHTNQMTTVSGIVIQSLVVLVWTCVLNWVCTLKYGVKISWLLVFLPLILVIILMVVFYHMIDTMGLKKEDIQKMLNNKDYNKDDDDDDDDNLIEGSCSSCGA